MQNIALNELWTLVVALLTIGLGTAVIARVPVLARYSIPPAVVGGFLAAGLFWGLSLGAAGTGVKVFFLLCVLVAGVYGAATASRKILYVQALPAAVGLALLWLAGR